MLTFIAESTGPLYVHGLFAVTESEWASREINFNFSITRTAAIAGDFGAFHEPSETEFEFASKDNSRSFSMSSTVLVADVGADVVDKMHCVLTCIGSLFFAAFQENV